MSDGQRSILGDDFRAFDDNDIAFALAWEIYAPGLCGWTVHREVEENGAHVILVDPPLVYGDGFLLRNDGDGVLISWSGGVRRAPTLRDALLLICPLSPDALSAAERLALEPEPAL